MASKGRDYWGNPLKNLVGTTRDRVVSILKKQYGLSDRDFYFTATNVDVDPRKWTIRTKSGIRTDSISRGTDKVLRIIPPKNPNPNPCPMLGSRYDARLKKCVPIVSPTTTKPPTPLCPVNYAYAPGSKKCYPLPVMIDQGQQSNDNGNDISIQLSRSRPRYNPYYPQPPTPTAPVVYGSQPYIQPTVFYGAPGIGGFVGRPSNVVTRHTFSNKQVFGPTTQTVVGTGGGVVAAVPDDAEYSFVTPLPGSDGQTEMEWRASQSSQPTSPPPMPTPPPQQEDVEEQGAVLTLTAAPPTFYLPGTQAPFAGSKREGLYRLIIIITALLLGGGLLFYYMYLRRKPSTNTNTNINKSSFLSNINRNMNLNKK
jgi:hypothetical protein